MKIVVFILVLLSSLWAVESTEITGSVREQLEPYITGEKQISRVSDSLVLLLFVEKNPALQSYWNSDTLMYSWRGVEVRQNRVRRIYFKNYNSASTMRPVSGLDSLFIPHEVYLLTELKSFTCMGPHIAPLPVSLKNMPNLQAFTLMEAGLQKVPEVVLQMTQLRMLQLTGNSIEEFPENFKSFEWLHTLHLSHNKLHSLPANIGKMRYLRALLLDNNNFTEIPEVLTELPSLGRVFLGNNNIAELNDVPLRCKGKPTFYLKENPFEVIPQSYGDYYAENGTMPVLFNLKNYKKKNIPTEMIAGRRGWGDISFIGSTCHFGGSIQPYSFEMIAGFLDNYNNLGGHVLLEPGYGSIKYGIGMHFKPLEEALPMPYFTDFSLRFVGTSLTKKNKRFGKSQFVGVEAAFVHNVGVKMGYHRNLDEKRNEFSIQIGASLMLLLSKIDLNFPG